ncbi:MAG TPA: alkaline phosphatase family protein [Terriglobales bacterium]|nr:alkaline phosphatase family protein [Terriglobales bacterium]
MARRLVAVTGLFFLIGFLGGCQGLVKGVSQLTVNVDGAGSGTITSSPAGINCPGTCAANFTGNPQVTLTETPAPGSSFVGWTGSGLTSCGTQTTCTVSFSGSDVTAKFAGSLQSINHIIFLAQENRSFDSYFGALRQYWGSNGIADQPFDGLPQFNPAGDPNAGPTPTNPGCDPAFPSPANLYCQIDPASPAVPSFHLQSMCVENPSPSWAESHRDWNVNNPVDPQALLNGFVDTAANDARQHTDNTGALAPYFDTEGIRAMGYYDGGDLNYYYALASTFATSDRWFAPVMTRTPPNREFMIAGTSNGYVYQRGGNPPYDTALIPAKTIFEELQAAGISWKIYVNPFGTSCQNTPTDVACLVSFSYIHDFAFGAQIKANPSQYTNNIVPISQFYTDAVNGTLPAVAQIEPASDAGLDEHPEDNDPAPGSPACCTIQAGANYVSTLINAVMCGQNNSPPSASCTPGPSWKDSAFIFTFDEPGGFYDHVPPQPTVSPDGIPPVDLFPNDPCYGNPAAGPTCDFTITGYRVPLVVVSPFTKKNFVSHQVRDTTAILKLIEKRFGVNSLTQRDAAQVDMDDPTTGFFDFTNLQWQVPPTNLPAQTVLPQSACFVNPPPTSP